MTTTGPSKAERLSQQGLDLLVAGDAAGAVNSFRAAINADPDCFEAHHGLIRALRDAGRLEQSIAAALAHRTYPERPLSPHCALDLTAASRPCPGGGGRDGASPRSGMEGRVAVADWRGSQTMIRRSTFSAAAAKRLRKMHDDLVRAYGPQAWWPAKSRFEVILGAYLTQNTSWKAVEVSLENLRDAGALTIDGLRSLPVESLMDLIRPSGFYRRKAPALKAFVAMLDAEFEGSLDRMAAVPVDTVRARLLALPGVGPETADAILLYALDQAVPVADEYLRRIALRHRLLDPPPQKNRKGYEVMIQLTRDAFRTDHASEQAALFNEFHALTVAVGKAHCGKTPDCEHCPLSGDLKHIRSRRKQS